MVFCTLLLSATQTPKTPQTTLLPQDWLFEGLRVQMQSSEPFVPNLDLYLKPAVHQLPERARVDYQSLIQGKPPANRWMGWGQVKDSLFSSYIKISRQETHLGKIKGFQSMVLNCQKQGLKICEATAHFEQGVTWAALSQYQNALAQWQQTAVQASEVGHVPLEALALAHMHPHLKDDFHQRIKVERRLQQLPLNNFPLTQVEVALLTPKTSSQLNAITHLKTLFQAGKLPEEKYARLLVRLAKREAQKNPLQAQAYLQEAMFLFSEQGQLGREIGSFLNLFAIQLSHTADHAYLTQKIKQYLSNPALSPSSHQSLLMARAQLAHTQHNTSQSLADFKQALELLSELPKAEASHLAMTQLQIWASLKTLAPLERYEPLLWPLMDTLLPGEQAEALEAMKRLEHPALSFGVVPYLSSPQKSIRRAALRTLEHHAHPPVAPVILRLLQQKSYPYKTELLPLLGDLLADTGPLLQVLPSAPVDVQAEVLKTLRWSKTVVPVGKVWPLLKSPDKEVRYQARYLLQKKAPLSALSPFFKQAIAEHHTGEDLALLMLHVAPQHTPYLKHIVQVFSESDSFRLKHELQDSPTLSIAPDLLHLAQNKAARRDDVFEVLFAWYKAQPSAELIRHLNTLLALPDQDLQSDALWDLKYRARGVNIQPLLPPLLKSPFATIRTKAQALRK